MTIFIINIVKYKIIDFFLFFLSLRVFTNKTIPIIRDNNAIEKTVKKVNMVISSMPERYVKIRIKYNNTENNINALAGIATIDNIFLNIFI